MIELEAYEENDDLSMISFLLLFSLLLLVSVVMMMIVACLFDFQLCVFELIGLHNTSLIVLIVLL